MNNNLMKEKIDLLSNELFKIKCSVGLDSIICNIDDIPDYAIIKNNINNLLQKYKINNFHYDLLFISKDVSKNNIDFLKIPDELQNEVKSYLGHGIDLSKYIRDSICNKFINQLLEIIKCEEFDMIYYDYESPDYSWARNTIEDAKDKIMIIKSLM